jgi:2,3-dihydroxyphenylpropionate 1,2-dioxygenase
MSSSLLCASHSPLLYCFEKPPEDWARIEAALAGMSGFVEDFAPDLIIFLGADHFNGFFLNMMPAFCVGLDAEATGDIGGYPGKLNVPQELGIRLLEFLRANDFDPAVSYQMTVDHAFSQTLHTAAGSLDRYPTIPIFVNCITRPFVPFRRVRQFGEMLGRFARSLNQRVLFMASGGMSHHPTRYYPDIGDGEPSVAAWQLSGGDLAASMNRDEWLKRLWDMHHEGAGMIARGERTATDMRLNEESDRRFIHALESRDHKVFDHWDADALIADGGIGSMELLTWIAAAAAHSEMGGASPKLDCYSVAPEIGIAFGVMSG